MITRISSNAFITIFKNSFIFECPKFQKLTISPNFCTIIDLYNMALSKTVKIACNLNDECLTPQTIEKTKVSIVANIFDK